MKKRFYRSSRDKMIAGIAGGIAEYFEVDPVLIRVAFVVLALSVGFGFLAYLLLWIIVPYDYELSQNEGFSRKSDAAETNSSFSEKKDSNNMQNAKPTNQSARNVAAAILILLGIILILHNIIDGLTLKTFGPAMLIVLGALILIFAKKNSMR